MRVIFDRTIYENYFDESCQYTSAHGKSEDVELLGMI